MTVTFGGDTFSNLRTAFNAHADESCALLLCSHFSREADSSRILVREIHLAPELAYSRRSPIEAELRPEALIEIVQRARNEGLTVVFAHSHPGSRGTPKFSRVDDRGEAKLKEFLSRRVPNRSHCALVLSEDGCACRTLGGDRPVAVSEVNSYIQRHYPIPKASSRHDAWDRQVRVFGEVGQAALKASRVAIVGLGGTGSLVAQQLAHLGVSSMVFVDPDSVEKTNLNRLVGAADRSVGRPKVDVAKAMVLSIQPRVKVETLAADVTDITVARSLAACDAVFGCTDSHASRAILNQLAYQYLLPVFDLGVGIRAKDGCISHVTGRVQMAGPGLPCLICSGVIDASAVRTELQSAAHRAADPYITGIHEPQPAVISLNGVMSSLAVTMFMAAFTGLPVVPRLQYFNALQGTVRPATLRPDPSCVVCSKAGALAQGDLWPLFGRPGSA